MAWKKRSKKGSQVEFVVSFILFVAFIAFAYALLSSKVDTGQSKQNSLESAEANIMSMISDNLTITSINANTPSQGSCFEFMGISGSLGLSNTMIAENGSGTIFPAYSDGTNLYITRLDQGSDFFRVYSSPEFAPAPAISGSCMQLSEGTEGSSYAIGISKNYSYAFEQKIGQLFSSYSTDYAGLKKEVQVFPDDDFGMKFRYSNGTVITAGGTNSTISVFADTVPVEYVNSTAVIQQGKLEIDVW